MSRYCLVGNTGVIASPSLPAVEAATAPRAPAPARIPAIALPLKPAGGRGTRAGTGAGAATGTHCTKPCTATGVTHDWAQSEDTTPSGVLTCTLTPGGVLMTALPS